MRDKDHLPNMKESRLVSFSVNHPRFTIVAAVIITALSLISVPKVVIDTDPENMLSETEPARVTHSQIKDTFNLSDFLLVGFVKDDTPVLTQEFAVKLALLTGRIESMEGVVSEDVIAPSTVDDIYRNDEGSLVVSGLGTARRGVSGRQLTLAERIDQNPIFAGKLASPDGRAVVLYVPLVEKSFAQQTADSIRAAMNEIGGFPPAYITGLPVAEVTFGSEMFKQMAIAAPMAGGLIFLLLLIFFRRLSVAIAAMCVAMMTVGISMGLLIAFGFTVHIMSSMIAIFLMPIAVLDSVHIISEFHDLYQKSGSQREAVVTTVNELYKPMLFTSLTTFVGFISLTLADIPPVGVFGAFVALGVVTAWALSVTFVPAFLVLIPKKWLSDFGGEDPKSGWLGRFLPKMGNWSIRRRLPIAVLSVVAFAVAGFGITKIEVNDNPTRWFKYDHPIRVAERALKERLAGAYLAYLEFDGSSTEKGLARTPEVLGYMSRLQEKLRSVADVGSTTGVTDIVKKVRFELHDGDSAKYSLPDSETEIAQELFLYEISGGDPEDLYKFITPGGERALLWIMLKEGDNQTVSRIVDVVKQFREANPPPSGLAFNWAGLSYINIVWQEKMVNGMLRALLGSVLAVALMMFFLLRSVTAGLISMIPLSLTIALVYGAIGFSGKAYDMPIAVLSALTLGLSIDFAIHFLKRGQEIFAKSHQLDTTLQELFGEPSRAIARNIIIIALGFTPLLFSALTPYVTVGVFLLAIMTLSGVATLVILPALVSLRGKKAFVRWGAGVGGANHDESGSN